MGSVVFFPGIKQEGDHRLLRQNIQLFCLFPNQIFLGMGKILDIPEYIVSEWKLLFPIFGNIYFHFLNTYILLFCQLSPQNDFLIILYKE